MNTHFFGGLLALCRERIYRCRAAIVWGSALITALLLLTVLIKLTFAIPYEELFRDALVVAEAPQHYGAISQFGLFLWWISAGALGVLYLLRKRLQDSRRQLVPYALGLTVCLALDDAFMLHESVPNIAGIPFTLLLYGGAIAVFLIRYLTLLLRTPFPLLVLSLGFLMGSMVIDEVPKLGVFVSKDLVFFIEDGMKLAGIIFWTGYYLMLSQSMLKYAIYRENSMDAQADYTALNLPRKLRSYLDAQHAQRA